jgi:hypothetical protein
VDDILPAFIVPVALRVPLSVLIVSVPETVPLLLVAEKLMVEGWVVLLAHIIIPLPRALIFS